MSQIPPLPDAERNALLDQLALLASDADARSDDLRTFLPLRGYTQAIHPRTVLVRGERGAGKSALFKFLRALKNERIPVRSVFRDLPEGEILWVEGFSEKAHGNPSPPELDQLAGQATDEDLRTFWIAHLSGCLSREARFASALPEPFGRLWAESPTSPARWLDAAKGTLSPIIRWLDDVDAKATATGETVSVTYDHLDKLGQYDAGIREKFVSTLLATWLTFSNRYSNLRAKVFLREDLYARAKRTPDASKLEARSVQLRWSREDLYRVFLRHLSTSDNLRALLGSWAQPIPFSRDSVLGWLPPEALPEEGPVSQQALCAEMVGLVMGAGTKKGYTHRWIPNHIQDAKGAIVPRSIINLFAFAATGARDRGPKATDRRLVTPQELYAGLENTSFHRVEELKEEHYVVDRLEGLRGLTVMTERKTIVARLSQAIGRNRDGFGDDGERALEELVQLGVLRIRDAGRIDVPDLYRYGYGIKRKGGVARPR